MGGKTFLALVAIAERLQRDEPALFIDWEDSADGTTARLLDLDCTPDQLARCDYISPSTALTFGIKALHELGAVRRWTLVVIDSAGESMAAGGIDPNADGQVATWMALAKSLTRIPSEPAVLMLDHVPKANDVPASYAIGSQRKLAAITGASYRCDTVIEPAIGKPGKFRLVVAKDRLGNRAKGSTAAEMHFDTDGDDLTIRLTVSEYQAAHDRGERFRPTVLMERVSRWLELNPGSSQRQIRESVEGKEKPIIMAIEVLIDEGYVSVADGARGARLHSVDKSFREVDDSQWCLVVPSGAPVVPGTGQASGARHAPPYGGGHHSAPLTEPLETSSGAHPSEEPF